MQVIIPMSGRGDRFQRAGYTEIKPLIPVEGRPMVEHVVSMFPPDSDFLFICAEDHLTNTPLRQTLERIAPHSRIVSIPAHKLGPVHSVVKALEHVRHGVPTLVSYCDYFAKFDFDTFLKFVNSTRCEGCIPSYRGFHPHSLGPNLYAYLRTEKDVVKEVREKGKFTLDGMSEFASAGLYYFATGSLIHKYFPKAIEAGLQVGGEYYASLPYNLMIQDKRDVRVFELPRFLQWGTPEDLEEYLFWSTHFAAAPTEPSTPLIEGTLLVPMAGQGSRFKQRGYREEKPLIPVAGIPMLRRTIESLPRMKRIVLVTREALAEALATGFQLESQSDLLCVALDRMTGGGMCTALAARETVPEDQPLLIAACDAALIHDDRQFAAMTARKEIDCIVWTFQNHPHANRHPEQYSWVALDSRSTITEVRYKSPVSEQVEKDSGMVGAFWFRRAGDFFEAAERVLAQGTKPNGEFHTELAVGEMIRNGKKAVGFRCTEFVCFGSPDDVWTYEYWASYFAEKSAEPQRKAG